MITLRAPEARRAALILRSRRGLVPSGVLLIVGMIAGSATLNAQSATTAVAPHVSRQAFSSLKWLEGRWRGSGGGYSAFYEEYRFLNDTTIEQREYSDSTFAQPRNTSRIVWSSGVAQKSRRGSVQSRVARIAGDTARFESANGPGGFTWIRVSNDEWLALLDGRPAPVRYSMKRLGG